MSSRKCYTKLNFYLSEVSPLSLQRNLLPCVVFFFQSSTWVTVVLALGRYLVICQPLYARRHLRLIHTRCALLVGIIAWFLLHLPMCWTFNVLTLPCEGEQSASDCYLYFLDIGEFALGKNRQNCHPKKKVN